MATVTDPITGQSIVDGAAKVTPEKLAGERNEGSTTGADHVVGTGEWAQLVVDHADGDVDVYTGPCVLGGYYVTEALSAHAWSIEDLDQTTGLFPVEASLAAHSNRGFPAGGPCGVFMPNGIRVKPHGSATAGKLMVFFRPEPATVTWPS